ncbi:MAG TPA: cytochrome c [Candidatus Binataceae bacterium]|nr:cytochrome c [Candidatus Binataceae bacterium]
MSESFRTRIRARLWIWIAPAIPGVAALALISTAARAAAVDLKAAASNYSASCVDCHGQSGKGDGPKASELKTKPANYTDCAAMSKFTDDYLFNVIKNGGKSVGKSADMADFGQAYSDDEIRGLVAYVRSFCSK